MSDREVMKLALEALEYAERQHGSDDCYAESIAALRDRLAVPDEAEELRAEIARLTAELQEKYQQGWDAGHDAGYDTGLARGRDIYDWDDCFD